MVAYDPDQTGATAAAWDMTGPIRDTLGDFPYPVLPSEVSHAQALLL